MYDMYEFVRETRHQRWDDGGGPWSVNRWVYEHPRVALSALVVLAAVLFLADGTVTLFDLLMAPTMVFGTMHLWRLEARAYREWKEARK